MDWDSLSSFSWFWVAAYCVICSAFVFRGEMSKDGPLIFSKKNVRSVRQVLIAHLMFLTILLALYRVAIATYLYMPNWMSERASRTGSWYDIFFLIAVLLFAQIERKWLFLPSAKPTHKIVRERDRSEY